MIQRHTNPRYLPLPLFVIAATSAALQTPGCASSGPAAARPTTHGLQVTAAQPTSAYPAPAATYTADARFIETVELSSNWAMHMAELQIAKGGRKEVKEVASNIKKRESVTLALLAKERARLGLPAAGTDHTAGSQMNADEERMALISGEDSDGFFVQRLLDQRRDIITTVYVAQRELTSASLLAFAQAFPQDREKDITDLRRIERATRPVPANSRAGRGIQTGPTKGTTTRTRR